MTATLEHEICLGPLTQIPLGEGRAFLLEGKEIAVFHTRHGVYATQALCPHLSGPLMDGLIGGTTLMCPLHAWKFDLTTGEALTGSCGVTTYPVRVTERGDIMLTRDLGRSGQAEPGPLGDGPGSSSWTGLAHTP